MRKNCYKTAESVSCGHPDSCTDYIVNSILDAYLAEDPNARVAIDGVFKNTYLTLGGEITSTAKIDIPSIVKRCLKEIGYTFEPNITLHIYEQSPDIALGTNDNVGGAGDQGTITGYACKGPRFIPLEKALADEIIRIMFTEFRPEHSEIKSDMKSQVTLHYDENGNPQLGVVVFACQHTEDADQYKITEYVKQATTQAVSNLGLDFSLTDLDHVMYIVNGTGKFILGGPEADSGEVGRKIVVDSYGVSVPVGGGTYNGKDPSKVDRSAAYMARYVAKNIVKAELADECLITVSYCIGYKTPISIEYDFFGTEKVPAEAIIEACRQIFSFEPAEIIKTLQLKRPIYSQAGAICHFGLEEKPYIYDKSMTVTVPWEQTNKVLELSKAVTDYIHNN